MTLATASNKSIYAIKPYIVRIFPVIGILFLVGSSQTSCQSTQSTTQTVFDDTTQFSTLEDVLALPALRNKVVYVDIWGTRCTPCIQEFPFLADLKKRYRDKPVTFLYLKSPYDFDDTKEWKEMIAKYHLEGIHVPMSISFYSINFWERFKDKYPADRTYGIPTYLIIDKLGHIVDFDAPRPSDIERLFPLLDKEI